MSKSKQSRKQAAPVTVDDDESLAGTNVVVLRGELSSEPVVRELPSGDEVTNLEVTTAVNEGRLSVPVVVHSRRVSVRTGDEIVVVGRVRRRFFRAGVAVQSRTEVVASTVVRSSQVVKVQRAIGEVLDELTA